jgi:hypothetical protein
MRVSGCNSHYEFVLGAGAKAKNRDKQLTFIVRVMGRLYFISLTVNYFATFFIGFW